jgi:hypothetical protein
LHFKFSQVAVKVAEVPRAFSTLEAEEGSTGPRRLEVTLVGVQHLPKMDGIMGRCDAYSKMLWRGIEYKTEVVKNAYDAEWNSSFSLDVEECANGTFPPQFLHFPTNFDPLTFFTRYTASEYNIQAHTSNSIP